MTRTAISPRLAIRTFCNTRTSVADLSFSTTRSRNSNVCLVSSIVWRVEHFDEIDSTNYLAGPAGALEGAPEGLVAFADFQSAGRGRLGPPVGVAAAVVACSARSSCDPTSIADQLQLVVACGGARRRAPPWCASAGVRPALKWPNDLMVGDTKLAGLLAEIVSRGRRSRGRGRHRCQPHRQPGDVAATDVLNRTGHHLSARGLLDIFLEELEWRYAPTARRRRPARSSSRVSRAPW